ncbi:MAG: dihydroorotate dehydrogenase [Candidatus Thermoplasmatota archaeon]|nr:dihydroorotate dehydrogenase [Candidatus Thermoplasmatota archaeon]
MEKTRLSVSLGGLEAVNPVFLASGILDETGASMARVARLGAGAVVTKSVGLEPRQGHPNPSVVETPCGLLNAMGLPNPGMEAYVEEMREAALSGVPVIASIYGSSAEEYGMLARMAKDAGASAIELNLSCPHAKGLGLEMGQDPALAGEIVRECGKMAQELPLFPKISPHVNNLQEMAHAFEKEGAAGIVAINTLRGMAIDVDARMPILGNKVGGLSGPAIKPVGLRVVYELYGCTRLPIIGVGGITTGRDALEYIMAGAGAVEVGTAVLFRGPEACGAIARELGELLERLGYECVAEAVGIAVNNRGESK